MSRSSATSITPRSSFNGLPAHEAARVHITTDLDRKQLKENEHSSELNPLYQIGDVRNLDVLVREPCFSIVKKRNRYHNSPMSNTHTVDVLSCLNGMGSNEHRREPDDEEACVRALMQRMHFVGFALDNVYYTPEFGGFNMTPKALAVHISGVYTLRAIVDMPLGAWVRLRPPTRDQLSKRDDMRRTNDGKLGSKVTLEPYPETSGKPFAGRVLDGLSTFIHKPDVYTDLFNSDTDKSDAQTGAFTAMTRNALLNFLFVANVLNNNEADVTNPRTNAPVNIIEYDAAGRPKFNVLGLAEAFGLFEPKLTKIGAKGVQSCFYDPALHYHLAVGYQPATHTNSYTADGRARTSNGGKLLLMQHTNHHRWIAGLCDLLRLDAEWIVGRVIRQAKADGGFDLFG